MTRRWINLLCICLPLAAAPVWGQSTKKATTRERVKDARDTVTVDPDTEKLIRGAVRFLAAKQAANGSWSSPGGEHPVAMTGYALMGLLATGQLPGEGEYGKVVNNGVNYLLACTRRDGYITSEAQYSGKKNSNMYDHGIALIALAEVYGQTFDPKLRENLQQSIKLLVSAQNREGGWRYAPRPESADISVTVLQVVALRACKNGGLDVPQKTMDAAIGYVKSCYDPGSGGFTYQPRNRAPGPSRTAAAIYSLQVCGLYEDELVKKGSEYLLRHGPDNKYYSYYSLYAAPAQYMVGGETWKKWYDRVRGEIAPKAVKQGDLVFWRDSLGEVYPTAINTVVLSMPYHYIPLYQR